MTQPLPSPRASRAAAIALAVLCAARAAPAQDDRPASPAPRPPSYALAPAGRYLPLESVRDGTVRMPRALARRVSVQRRAVPLQQVILDIATQAGLGLSYGEDLARSGTVVSLAMTNASAAEALAAAVRDTPWAVMVTASGQIAVVPAERRQLGGVSGRVTDRATGLPVAGATLTLDGTRLSATADDSGRFRIRGVPAGSYTLVARRIGYARSALPAAVAAPGAGRAAAAVEVALDAAATSLDQIVITGVPDAVSKRTLGSAVTTIDAAAVTRRVASASVTELLQARAPGVAVLPGGGSPGTGASIRIRGAGSLVAATAPVIYLDGVRIYTGAQGNFWNSWRSQRSGEQAYGAGQDAMALDMLKPEEIESIEVIKGPAAATLYGADAANGVIQIITRKGTRGAGQGLAWSTKLQGGVTDWAVDRVTNYTTCTPAVIALRFADGAPRFPGCQGKAPGTILSARSLDLPGALRTGAVRSAGLSVRGGGARHSFFASAGRDEEEGVFFNSANRRSAARANVALYPRPDLDLSASAGYSHTGTRFPVNDDGYGLIESAMLYRPGSALRSDLPDARDGFDAGNGPERVYRWDNRLRADRVIAGATASWRPAPWLRTRLTLGLDRNVRVAEKALPPGTIWGSGSGLAERGTPRNAVRTVDWSATASGLPGAAPPALSSAFSLGAQYASNTFRSVVATAAGGDGPAGAVRFTELAEQKALGLYAQEQIGWGERLYLTAALRVDNNSVFGREIRRLVYPKLSAAWVVSEEPAVRRALRAAGGWADQVKLRAAWGQAGNAPAPFAGRRSFTTGTTVDERGVRVPALRTDAYGNPRIRPERGTEIELGADASLFGGRFGAEVTHYRKTTRDALMEVAVPASTGFVGFRRENLGEIANAGLELALSAVPLDVRALRWESRLGLATNRNRLVSFGDGRAPMILSLYGGVQRHQPGYPLGGYWGSVPLRDAAGALVRDPASGALIAGEPAYIGPSTPTRELSASNTVTLPGGLSLHALVDYKGGHYLYNVKDQYRCWGQPLATAWSRDPAERLPGQCWPVNDPARSDESKELLQQPPAVNSGLFIQRADFIKLRDLSATWELPAAWTRRAGSERAALTLAAHNVGFLWKPHYTGPDPEVNFTGVNDPGGRFAYIRVDSWTAPMTRRITLSLEAGF